MAIVALVVLVVLVVLVLLVEQVIFIILSLSPSLTIPPNQLSHAQVRRRRGF